MTGPVESHAMSGRAPLTLLMLFCYTSRQEPNCHQRGFTQQLMKTDADRHRQTVGRAEGIQQKEGIRIVRARRVKDTIRKSTESTKLVL